MDPFLENDGLAKRVCIVNTARGGEIKMHAEFKDIKLPKKSLCPEAIAREFAFNPEDRMQRLLESAAKLPPLMTAERGGACACGSSSAGTEERKQMVYDMGPENAGKVRAFLRLVSDAETFDISVPLEMIPYKTPGDPKQCFDPEVCKAVDAANEEIENHNRYITSLLSIFIRENGCGTSANHVTLPPPPESLSVTRINRLQNIFKDKHASTCLAVRYLFTLGKNCGKDYDIADAVKYADDVAFEEAISQKISSGKPVRVRAPGSGWVSWSGKVEDPDTAGRRLTWTRGHNHSFLSPEICATLVRDPEPGDI